MNNYTNIYDVDGNIIRKAGDNHKFTIDEVEKMVDEMTEMVQKNPDNQVYKVYLNNLQKWLFSMYNSMSKEDIIDRLSTLSDTVKKAKEEAVEMEMGTIEEINKNIEEFKAQYEEKPENTEEKQ